MLSRTCKKWGWNKEISLKRGRRTKQTIFKFSEMYAFVFFLSSFMYLLKIDQTEQECIQSEEISSKKIIWSFSVLLSEIFSQR